MGNYIFIIIFRCFSLQKNCTNSYHISRPKMCSNEPAKIIHHATFDILLVRVAYFFRQLETTLSCDAARLGKQQLNSTSTNDEE